MKKFLKKFAIKRHKKKDDHYTVCSTNKSDKWV